MVYVNRIILNGFKGYKDETSIIFTKDKNILIGDNGIGKTSVVQALKLLLKGSRFEYNGVNYLAKYVNNELCRKWEESQYKITKLPKFKLTLFFDIEDNKDDVNYCKFCGQYRDSNGTIISNQCGITFEYCFDERFKDEYNDLIDTSSERESIPFNMYKVDHKTFNGDPYYAKMDPLKSIFINNDEFEGNPYNIFTNQLYSAFSVKDRAKLEGQFRKNNASLFDGINKHMEYNFSIDTNGIKFPSIIDVSSNENISFKELGSGKENLLKTRLGINSESNLIVIEEPENHLTASNAREQIAQLRKIPNQLIVTTHNSQIVTSFDLNKVQWIRKNLDGNREGKSFADLAIHDKKLSKIDEIFFEKRDDVNFLNLLTSKKIILVEGAGEYILMRTFIKKVFGEDHDEFEIVSMRGRYFDPFVNLALLTSNKLVIFTDNDYDKNNKDKHLKYLHEKNKKLKKICNNIQLFFEDDFKMFTFEAAEFYQNKDVFESKKIKIRKDGKDALLDYMLNNKTAAALRLINYYNEGVLKVPKYIEKGLLWLKD